MSLPLLLLLGETTEGSVVDSSEFSEDDDSQSSRAKGPILWGGSGLGPNRLSSISGSSSISEPAGSCVLANGNRGYPLCR